ncbi:hypothetical protein BD414DRAFT_489400 [Trametes punicea]|nr:hypothetical protein BD414DRAFT_489400 [Trametes punicea]
MFQCPPITQSLRRVFQPRPCALALPREGSQPTQRQSTARSESTDALPSPHGRSCSFAQLACHLAAGRVERTADRQPAPALHTRRPFQLRIVHSIPPTRGRRARKAPYQPCWVLLASDALRGLTSSLQSPLSAWTAAAAARIRAALPALCRSQVASYERPWMFRRDPALELEGLSMWPSLACIGRASRSLKLKRWTLKGQSSSPR